MPDFFIPIDAIARDGTGYLVRTADGCLHAASFAHGKWCYSGDPHCPVLGEVTDYRPGLAARRTSCAS